MLSIRRSSLEWNTLVLLDVSCDIAVDEFGVEVGADFPGFDDGILEEEFYCSE